MQSLGTPYPESYDEKALEDLEIQAAEIAAGLVEAGVPGTQETLETKEIIALIAYLQRLGTDIKPEPIVTK